MEISKKLVIFLNIVNMLKTMSIIKSRDKDHQQLVLKSK